MEHPKIGVTVQEYATYCLSNTGKNGVEQTSIIPDETLTQEPTKAFGIFSDMLFYY